MIELIGRNRRVGGVMEVIDCIRITSSKVMPRVKELLAWHIADFYNKSNMTQKGFGKAVSLDQPKISLLLSGDIRNFSLERLINIVNLLGLSVGLSINKRK